jgi:exosortase
MVQFRNKRLPVMPALAGVWLAVLMGLVFAGPIAWLVRQWQDNPYYEHGPFVPLVSLVLAAVALPRLVELARGRPGGVGPVLVIAGLILRILGASAGSDFLGAVALVFVLAGFAGWWLGRPGMQTLAFPIGYLFLAIPLPFMDDLGFYFQRLSSATTTVIVRLVRVPAIYQGAEVSLPDASFIVGIPCSGLYSTVTLTALGLLYLRLLDLRSWRRKLLLIALIPPVAVATNVFRLSSLLGLAHWQSADVAMRYYHDLGDVVFWFVAMALLFAIGKGLERTQS